MRKFLAKQNVKLFILGILLGIPIVLSFSGHFLLFWLRSIKIKFLILLVLIPLAGILIGFFLHAFEKNKRNLNAFELMLVFILPFVIVLLGFENFKSIPLPISASTSYTLTLTKEEKNSNTLSGSIKFVGVKVKPVDQGGFITLPKRSCDGVPFQTEDGFSYFELAPGNELRCSFLANPREEVKLVFWVSPAGGTVQAVLRAEKGQSTSVQFDLYFPEQKSKTFPIYAPNSYLTLLFLFLDVFSLVIILALTIYALYTFFITSSFRNTFLHLFSQYLRQNFRMASKPPNMCEGRSTSRQIWRFAKLFGKLAKVLFSRIVILLPSTMMMVYLVLYPIFSGYIVAKDRYDFQFSEWPQFERMIRDVTRYVPEDSSLAIIFPGKYPVSPMFGPAYTRRLLPQYPAPESITTDYLNNLDADYLLMSAELFERENLGADGQLHFVIYGGGEILYPNYSLYSVLESGLEIVASCVREPDCQARYYLFRVQR